MKLLNNDIKERVSKIRLKIVKNYVLISNTITNDNNNNYTQITRFLEEFCIVFLCVVFSFSILLMLHLSFIHCTVVGLNEGWA